MYEINKQYKFEMPNRIFYTGKVIEEDSTSIKIISKRNEKLVLNKGSIVQSIEIEDSIGDSYGTR